MPRPNLLPRATLSALVVLVLTAAPALAQDTYTWHTTTTSNAWLDKNNWTTSDGGPNFPGGTPNGGLDNGVTTDIAVIGTFGFTAANGLEIDMSAAGAQGLLMLGAIEFNSATANLQIGSSAGNGIVELTGGTINSVSNVLVANTSGSRDLTIANTASGSGSQTMGLRLGVASGVFLVNSGRTITVNSIISEGGANRGFSVQGGGTLVLGAANSYAGPTTITGSVLSTNLLADGGTASGLGQSSSAATNLILNGGTLRYTGAAVSTNRLFTVTENGAMLDASGTGAVNLTNTGAVAFSGSGARTLTLTGNNTGANTLRHNLGDGTGGATSLTKSGPGTWVLSGTNTFTGAVNITGGVLQIGASAQITPSGTATVTLDGGTLRHTANAAVTFITATHPIVIGPGGGTIDTPGASGTLIYAPAATATLITPAVPGTGVITKTGPGVFRLTQGGFSANNTVQKLVVLGGLWQGGLDTVFGAVPGSALPDAITLNGGGISSNSGFVLNANRGITLGSAGGTISTISNLTYNGKITGTGSLTKTGANMFIIGGATNDYTGGTTITAGTVQLTSGNNRLPTSGNLTFSGGTLDLNTRSQTINVLSSTGGAGNITTVAAGTVALTVGNGDGSGSFSGIIQNGGGTTSFTKIGTGTQTLTGNNTYSGGTTVSAGTLLVNGQTGSVSGTGTGAVGVGNTATFGGTGRASGAVTVNNGGTLAPGVSGAGTLTIGGNTVLNSGAKLAIGAAAPGTSSGVLIQGASTTVDFKTGSILDLSLLSGFGAAGSYTLFTMPIGSGGNVLLDAAATTDGQVLGSFVQGTGASGAVTIIPSGFSLAAGDTFTLSRSGEAVVLNFQPVPEPGMVLGLCAGVLGAGAWIRRRVRNRATLAA